MISDSLCDFDRADLEMALADHGCKPVHASKALRYFYESAGRPISWPDSLSRGAIEFLSQMKRRSRVATAHRGSDGTTKILVHLADGKAVESVLMPGYRGGFAAGCVSSQIGCAMGCDFCASTRNGLDRNLDAGEIVEQFLHLKELAASQTLRLKTLVFMGMGEPLLNLDNVLPAVKRIADPDLGGLGWRQVTVSTVGIVPGIDRLIAADLNIHLALSLHAPDDFTRGKLVPSNRRYPVAEIMAAVRRFYTATGRVPTIEYCMLAGVNDTDEQAHQLAELMTGLRGHVNLIPYNSIGAGLSGTTYTRPSADRMRAFLTILRDRKVVAHFRDTAATT